MNNLIKIFSSLMIIIASTAYAQTFLTSPRPIHTPHQLPATLVLSHLKADDEDNSPVLYFVTLVTPNGQPFETVVKELTFYAGSSTTAPCSDLVPHIHEQDIETYFEPLNQYPITSDHMLYDLGPAYSCIRYDIDFGKDKIVTSGNIQLIWDSNNKIYTGAIPNQITIQL